MSGLFRYCFFQMTFNFEYIPSLYNAFLVASYVLFTSICNFYMNKLITLLTPLFLFSAKSSQIKRQETKSATG